jgi:hypothetical protein
VWVDPQITTGDIAARGQLCLYRRCMQEHEKQYKALICYMT